VFHFPFFIFIIIIFLEVKKAGSDIIFRTSKSYICGSLRNFQCCFFFLHIFRSLEIAISHKTSYFPREIFLRYLSGLTGARRVHLLAERKGERVP